MAYASFNYEKCYTITTARASNCLYVWVYMCLCVIVFLCVRARVFKWFFGSNVNVIQVVTSDRRCTLICTQIVCAAIVNLPC